MDLINIQKMVHKNAVSKGFWEKDSINLPEKLCLVHSEVSEALEELRKPELDYYAFAEELADVIIRTLDIGAWLGYNMEEVVLEKHQKNLMRPRLHGKKF